jgi:hypothetical protein
MLGRIAAVLLAIGFAIALASTAEASTTTCPTSQTITIGTIQQGSYNDLCAEDGVFEILKEGLDNNGKSKLRKTFVIPNVPAGTQYLNFWGTRPANSEGDNFQFYYNTTGQPIGILISGGLINKPFAPTGGITVPLNITTTQTTTFYILLSDTNGNGPILDTVTLDTVRIVTQ